jgi:hypothetical protein
LGHLVFYEQPEILNRLRHRHYRFRPGSRSFRFAAKTNSVVLCGVEFVRACHDFPVLFIRGDSDKFAPVVLLGLRDGENLFVDADGNWTAAYIPAFVRRYPFVLVEEGTGFSVGFDAVSTDIVKEGKDGVPLFDADDAPAKALAEAIQFLQSYQAAYLDTAKFTSRLAELGLFREVNATAELRPEARFVLTKLFAVDPAKLAALDAAALKELANGPWLTWIYAHLLSLELMPRLADKLSARLGLSDKPGGSEAKLSTKDAAAEPA